MFKLSVNERKGTIEMSKKFAEAAKKFGTEEYKALQEVRRDYPGFKTKVVSHTTSKKVDVYAGLTYEYMEKYIEGHDNSDANMAEYKDYRGTSEMALALGATSASYVEIKRWFLGKYPEIAKFYEKREALLAS